MSFAKFGDSKHCSCAMVNEVIVVRVIQCMVTVADEVKGSGGVRIFLKGEQAVS